MDTSGVGEERATPSVPLLKRLVAESHALLLYDNAAFLADRLLALDWGIESAYWVAQSHFLLGDHARVVHFLKPLHPLNATFPQCKDFGMWFWRLLHVWGVCCLRLHMYQNAEQIFLQQQHLSYTCTVAEQAANHYYLGLVARQLRNAKGATHHFVESFTCNPFLFTAFEEACTTGYAASLDPASIFGSHSGASFLEEHVSSSSFDDDLGEDDMAAEGDAPPKLQPPRPSPLSRKATTAPRKAPRPPTGLVPRQALQPYPSNAATPKRVRTGRRPAPASAEDAVTAAGAQALLQLLATMGEAFRLLCIYKCPECLQTLEQLPLHHSNTGWVLSVTGRAHVELADYTEACAVFKRLRRAEPYRLEGLVEYSSALYQLKKDKELSALAQSMAQQDRFSSHTLCVLANCFSLAGDHDAAVRFLTRAAKQHPCMWYTHTLLGHEHFIQHDIDEALQHYRTAMLMNPLHFNAWYGIGQVYMKQEQYAQAQHYFSVAIRLNGNSSPLHFHLAMTLENQDKYREALENLHAAITLQPGNLLARLKWAQLNLRLGKTAEALQELEFMRDRAPKEPQIFITLGKCYYEMGQKQKALQCFNLAMDLEPKENLTLKRYMERCLSVPDPAR